VYECGVSVCACVYSFILSFPFSSYYSYLLIPTLPLSFIIYLLIPTLPLSFIIYLLIPTLPLSFIIGASSNLLFTLAQEKARVKVVESMVKVAERAIVQRRELEAEEAGRRQRDGLIYPPATED
jgi:hypothetical protein